MRRFVPILLVAIVVLFYVGVAGAAASPYVGAIFNFVHSATSQQPDVTATAFATPTARSHARKTARPTSTAIPTRRPAGPTPTPIRVGTPPAATIRRLARSTKLPRNRINILVLGSDNDQKFASYAHPLTQVMIVLSVDPATHKANMVSIPRDFWVRIPGYPYNTGPDGTSGWAKIDVASKLPGGFKSAACAVEYNFGVHIDGWIWVGLNGFIRAVDTLSGVALDVTHPVIDDNYPDDLSDPSHPYGYRRIYIPPGPQHLSGDASLLFVRSRHGDINGDFGRSSRQQILLTQLRREFDQYGAEDKLLLIPSLLKDFTGEIKTNLSADIGTIVKYWSLLRGVDSKNITQVVLSPPTYSGFGAAYDNDPQVETEAGSYPNPWAESIVWPYWQPINAKIQELFGGQDWSNSDCPTAFRGASTP